MQTSVDDFTGTMATQTVYWDVILPGTHNSGSFSITTRNAVIVDKMIPLQAAFKLGLKVDTIMSKFHPRNCIPLSMKCDE